MTTATLDTLDTTAVLSEILTDAIPNEETRQAAIATLLHQAADGDMAPKVLWCWGPAGYESPSAPLGTARSQAKSLGSELSWRFAGQLRALPEDGSVPAGLVGGEAGRWVRQALAGVVPDGAMDATVEAILDGKTYSTGWGWWEGETLVGSYPREMAEKRADGRQVGRFLSLRTRPRGHHRVG